LKLFFFAMRLFGRLIFHFCNSLKLQMF
jgi:hypothetical protein